MIVSLFLPTVVVGILVMTACGGGEDVNVPESDAPQTITVTSTAFEDGEPIPQQFTCQGEGSSPPLDWTGVPADAASLALVVTDPDAPRGTFVHWVLYDLPARDSGLAAGEVPAGASEADNSAGKSGWYPPCPPSGTHRYVFTLYALSEPVTGRRSQDVLDEIARVAVARGSLTGTVASR